METRKSIAVIAAITMLTVQAAAYTKTDTVHYRPERYPNMPTHFTRMVQDRQGLFWIASWNGLYRFDGYEFVCFKSSPGDGVPLPSDRVKNVFLNPDGRLCCNVDDQLFFFNPRTYQFSLPSQQELRAAESLKSTTYFNDAQRNEWHVSRDTFFQVRFNSLPFTRLDIRPTEEIRGLTLDSRHRYWLTGHDRNTIRIYRDDNSFMGYLDGQGVLSQSYCEFPAPVYCLHEGSDGTIWLGCKPGLFRLTADAAAPSNFNIRNYPSFNDIAVYGMAEDGHGNIYLGTLYEGLWRINAQAPAQHPVRLENVPIGKGTNIRALHITRNGILLAATTEGLVVGDLSKPSPTFRIHRREPGRTSSLSNNATMNLFEDNSGLIYICTESGGINMVHADSLLNDELSFRHLDARHGLSSDIAQSIFSWDDTLWVVQNNAITRLRGDSVAGSYGPSFFKVPIFFSDAVPVVLPSGQLLLGLLDGAITLDGKAFRQKEYVPPLVITNINIENKGNNHAVTALDTLVLASDERDVYVQFAALIYGPVENVKYEFRLDDGKWTRMVGEHSASLLDLKPGMHIFQVRSTNDDGVWVENTRTLVIYATPQFSETLLAKILFVLLAVIILLTVWYTYSYIRTIKRNQKEMLEKYLVLVNNLEHSEVKQNAGAPKAGMPEKQHILGPDDEAFMQRIVSFVEKNIDNPNVNINDMANAAACSRSSMTRRLRSITGVNPNDFFVQARIDRAKKLLRGSTMNISEIAYACGFTAPKYFSRIFKKVTGESPSKFKSEAWA